MSGLKATICGICQTGETSTEEPGGFRLQANSYQGKQTSIWYYSPTPPIPHILCISRDLNLPIDCGGVRGTRQAWLSDSQKGEELSVACDPEQRLARFPGLDVIGDGT